MKRILLLLIFFPQLLLSVQPQKWTAQWIMQPTVQPQAHAVVLFRKNFEFAEKPESFIVHVSADNLYRLFVNGQYILRGPARGDLSHWFYETVDITETSVGHKTVEIAPSFGELLHIKAVYPHPLGNIELDLQKVDSKVEGTITVPNKMLVTFVWGNQKLNLKVGKQNITIE